MKYNWVLVILFMSHFSSAQIILDNVVSPQIGIGEDFFTVQISSTETKYLFEDTLTNTFSLYNMDFTSFLVNNKCA